METYFNYIIESGISLGVFTLVYWLLLRKEVMLKASRIYLLVAVLFSTLLPFFSINLYNTAPAEYTETAAETIVLETNLIETVTVYASGIPAKVGRAIISIKPSVWFYITGATLALFFILAGIVQLLSMISKNRSFRLRLARLVVTRKEITPYSFFNFIFISRDLPEKENWKAMVHHELEHVKQGHSFDVLFIDFMMVFQWFNPFYWIIRRLVCENHEFLADRAVLQRGAISPGRYKALLLSQAIGGKMLMTSNFFNVKTIQKRFKMITKNKTRKFGLLKYSLGVVAALSITMCFAVSNSVPGENNDVLVKAEIPLDEPSLFEEPKDVSETKIEVFNNEIAFPASKNKMETICNANHSSSGDEQIKNEKQVNKTQLPPSPGGAGDSLIGWKVWVTPKQFLYFDPEFDTSKISPDKKICIIIEENNPNDMEIARKLDIESAPQNKVHLKSTNVPESKVPDDVFIIVEDMPEYPGGEDSLRYFIAQNVKYPKIAKEQGIQGKVYVMFVVSESGKVENAEVVRGADPYLNQEALRVINSMPEWKPGKQRGVPVKVQYTVPINFQLDKDPKPKKNR
jgi:TonB family protein